MSAASRIGVLVAVFVVATVSTGFAAALALPVNGSTSFVFQVWFAAVHFGWAAGLTAAGLFGLLYFRKNGENAKEHAPAARR